MVRKVLLWVGEQLAKALFGELVRWVVEMFNIVAKAVQ